MGATERDGRPASGADERNGSDGGSPLRRARGHCARCGAHVVAIVGLQTVAGMCEVCGSPEIVELEA